VRVIYILSLTLLVLAASTSWAAPAPIQQEHQHSSDFELDLAADAEVEYICPMHSHIVRDEPGSCPICGMDLEPRERGEQVAVSVSAEMQQNLGIETTRVQRQTLWRYIQTQGRVAWNQNKLYHVHPRVSGWLETLAVRSEGQRVEQGDLLYEMYSQELVVAQQDHLQTLDALNNMNSNQRREALQRDGRKRLRLLGLTEAQVDRLERERQVQYQVPFYAQSSGIVTELPIAEGMYVQPGSVAMTIAGADALWLIADVPEHQSQWFTEHSPVEIDLPQAGIQGGDAEIDYIYPELDETTRTVRVRINLPELQTNARNKLLVGQQAEVALYGGPKRDVIAIPTSALIMTGANNRVLVRDEDGNFKQQDVHVGLTVNGMTEVLHGLDVDDVVVTAGQFLLDSEASLMARPRKQQQENAADHEHH